MSRPLNNIFNISSFSSMISEWSMTSYYVTNGKNCTIYRFILGDSTLKLATRLLPEGFLSKSHSPSNTVWNNVWLPPLKCFFPSLDESKGKREKMLKIGRNSILLVHRISRRWKVSRPEDEIIDIDIVPRDDEKVEKFWNEEIESVISAEVKPYRKGALF